MNAAPDSAGSAAQDLQESISIAQLIHAIQRLASDEPLRRLRVDPTRSSGHLAAGSLLVQGDNLLTLMVLLPYY